MSCHIQLIVCMSTRADLTFCIPVVGFDFVVHLSQHDGWGSAAT